MYSIFNSELYTFMPFMLDTEKAAIIIVPKKHEDKITDSFLSDYRLYYQKLSEMDNYESMLKLRDEFDAKYSFDFYIRFYNDNDYKEIFNKIAKNEPSFCAKKITEIWEDEYSNIIEEIKKMMEREKCLFEHRMED